MPNIHADSDTGIIDFYPMFKQHSSVMLLVDADSGNIIDANTSACKYYGYAEEKIKNMNIYEINVSDPYEVKLCMEEARRQNKNYFVFRHKKANGEIRDVEVNSTEILSGGRKLLFSIIHDITDSILAQKKLDELNTRLELTVTEQSKDLSELAFKFQTVFEYSGIGILLLDTNGAILEVNPAFCTMTGKNKNSVIHSRLHTFFDDADCYKKIEEVVDTEFDFIQFEQTINSNDGQKPVNITLSPVRKNEEIVDYILCIVENISYKKSLEKKQQEQEIMLIQQSKMAAMGEMIGAIAHQWRQPLNAIALIVQDFKSAYEFGELDEKYIDDSVSKGMKQIAFMSKTIDAFRNFFKPGKEVELFCAYEAVQSVCGLVDAGLLHSKVQISLSFSDDAKTVCIEGYKNEFKQAVLNIVSNAKDAILERKNGGSIEIKGDIVESRLEIVFEDDGGGVDDTVINRIFEPYFTTKEQGKGTGIGLYMTKMIIEEHMDGIIKVYNGDKGAVFKLSFNFSGYCKPHEQ